MARLLDGRALADAILGRVEREAMRLQAERGRPPGLSVVLVGDDPASTLYARNKEKASRRVGITSMPRTLPASTTEADLLGLVDELNRRDDVDGILVQRPLPPAIRESRIMEAIDPAKDVDGFHPVNLGRLCRGRPLFQPCALLGILALVEAAGVRLEGIEAAVVGMTTLIGRPLAMVLVERRATVRMLEPGSPDLPSAVARAELLVTCAFHAGAVRGEWIRPGAVVIDAGINRRGDGTLVGDVEGAGAAERAAALTPVPGGVGPMIIALLMSNTLEAARRRLAPPAESKETR